MIATTIEQSKKLIELEINIDTADMYYYKENIFNNALATFNGALLVKGNSKLEVEYTIPAWSLSALMEPMPNKIWINDDLYFVCFKKNSAELRGQITWDGRQKTKLFKADNILDATFEMMCYLLENKLI